MARLVHAVLPAIDAGAVGAVLCARLLDAVDAEAALVVAPIVGEALILGSFQRARSAIDLEQTSLPIARRATGGGVLHACSGQLYVALDLRRASALGAVADPNRAINRHVRPLLRALSSLGKSPATYGGRLSISMAGEPIAWIGVGHNRASGATWLESIIAVEASFALDPSLDLAGRPALRDSWTLSTAIGSTPKISTIAEAIVAAFVAQANGDASPFDPSFTTSPPAEVDEPPFTAMIEEAIGFLGAVVEPDHDRVFVGGELMASTDALTELSHALIDEKEIAAAIDAALAPSLSTLCFGVRSLRSIENIVRAAFTAQKGNTRET